MDPVEKEATERFVASLGDFEPCISDHLTSYLLSQSGFQCNDVKIIRLIALASQKFASDVASDAMAFHRLRQSAQPTSKSAKAASSKAASSRSALSLEDLCMALREYGIDASRAEYFVDSPPAAATGSANTSTSTSNTTTSFSSETADRKRKN